MRLISMLLLLLTGWSSADALAQRGKKKKKEKEKTEQKATLNLGGFKFRSIGPALTEGRITDIAVHPEDKATWILTVASGGVWHTENAGTTWSPVMDGAGSYSMGCVTIDPNNPLIVWVGSGENNSQRSVGYGDGIYKSVNGGKSFKNMGLKDSEHIAKIHVDPRDSDTVLVAVQGPLWSDGGDRGLYKTTDGGKEWRRVLEISEMTGVTDLVVDPRDPDVMYAASYQRRRHVWTLINGGPESTIYKSTDGGETWNKAARGIPGGDVGRIGLAIAPTRPDTIYAIVEAAGSGSGFYRSTNAGASWHKRSGYLSGSPQYYQEIIVDPNDPEVIYSNDTYLNRSVDGGKTFSRVGNDAKHVDDHVTWIDPDDSSHLLVGSDGGLYESWDSGEKWLFRGNLPIVQFYKISTDNAEPFYNVYGGTQDNYSLAGPSRTTNSHGIRNADWFVTHGGDGFETQVDPTDHNIIYAQSQYGVLVRYDRHSGEETLIQPQPPAGEVFIWNWDSPLLISPHDHKRLYFAGNLLFRSDDRGNSWQAVSPDLTRGLDRNKLEVMGRIWSVDAVSKNRSTSIYGNIVAFDESPLKEGFLIVGTDDGLIQISEDGGDNWRKIESFPGVPERTYVNFVKASLFDENVIYAGFNNHKMGDFKPYILKSTDKGASWTSIAADLPERGSIYSFVQDHENKDLLFCGTEFGLFVSIDGAASWTQMKSGLPTVAVRDLEIQKRENDLVVGTFGRGIYILDDYTPLRSVKPDMKEAVVYKPRAALAYYPSSPLGGGTRGFQGSQLYVADNPPFGAVITYYNPESLKTRKQKRQKEEKKIAKDGGDTPYPSWDALREEDREEKPRVILTITDDQGKVVRRLTGKTSKGFHRVDWDLRYPSTSPISGRGGRRGGGGGPMVVPGTYTVALSTLIDGKMAPLGGPQAFEVKALDLNPMAAEDKDEVLDFQMKVAELSRVLRGASAVMGEVDSRINAIEQAIMRTAAAGQSHIDMLGSLKTRMADLRLIMNGDTTVSSRSEPTPPGLSRRLGMIGWAIGGSSVPPTQTAREGYDTVAGETQGVLDELRSIIEGDLATLESQLEMAGAPWTPGRFPVWKK